MTKTYDFWKKNKIDKLRLGNEVGLGEIKVALSMCQIIFRKASYGSIYHKFHFQWHLVSGLWQAKVLIVFVHHLLSAENK